MKFLGQDFSVRKVKACLWQCSTCGCTYIVQEHDVKWSEVDSSDPRERSMQYVVCEGCKTRHYTHDFQWTLVPASRLEGLETIAANLAGDADKNLYGADAWARASEEKKFHWRLKAAKLLFEKSPQNKE
jgi:hypothetical protein